MNGYDDNINANVNSLHHPNENDEDNVNVN